MNLKEGDKVRAIRKMRVTDIEDDQFNHTIKKGDIGIFQRKFIWSDYDDSEQLEFEFPSGGVYLEPEFANESVEKIEEEANEQRD
ncbi:hypothetical protein EEL30_06500 [Brevibacillus laterosporus]|uniref:Uncharacterized protein n=1 Tax=Brevibacillus laterosporus TaxID=1465 RepID=A0A518V4Y1_BRELA|nr:hypothetical protein EEL30_06500 [Brevibacillus laterosporus]